MSTKTCPCCGTQMDASVKFCGACGSDMTTIAPDYRAPAVSTAAALGTCPNCGKPIERPGQKFCGGCGMPFAPSKPAGSHVASAAPAAAHGSASPTPSHGSALHAAPSSSARQAAPSHAESNRTSVRNAPAPRDPVSSQRPARDVSSSGRPSVRNTTGPQKRSAAAANRPGGSQGSSRPSSARGAVGNVAGGVAAAVSSVRELDAGNVVSRFNDRMGTAVDFDSVGKDFSAASIRLESASEEALARAFNAFGKALPSKQSETEGSHALAGNVHSRREGSDVDSLDTGAKSMAEFDTSARALGSEHSISYGRFATGLSEQLVPRAELVMDASSMAAGESRTRKDRLKRQVEMGEMSMNEAVERAER